MLCSINIIEDSNSQKYENFYVYLISFEETFNDKSSDKYWGLGLKKFEPAVSSDEASVHSFIEKMNVFQKDTNKRIYQELDIIPITPSKISDIKYDFNNCPSIATIFLSSPNKTIKIINYDYEGLEKFIENLNIFRNGHFQLCNCEEVKFKMDNQQKEHISNNFNTNGFFTHLVDIYLNIPYSSEVIKLLKNSRNLKKVVINDMLRYDIKEIISALPEDLEYFGYTYQKCSHLPEIVKKFKKLTTLDLSGNYLWKLPTIVTLFPSLKKLILNNLVEPMIIVPVKFIHSLRNVLIEYSILIPEACDDVLLARNAEMACRLYCDCRKQKSPFKKLEDDDSSSYQSRSKECSNDSTGDCSEDNDSLLDEEDLQNTFVCDGCHNKCSMNNHECFFVWGPLYFLGKNDTFKCNLQKSSTKFLYVYQMCDKCKIGFSGNEYATLEKDYRFNNDTL